MTTTSAPSRAARSHLIGFEKILVDLCIDVLKNIEDHPSNLPHNNATCAQAAVILMQFCEQYVKP